MHDNSLPCKISFSCLHHTVHWPLATSLFVESKGRFFIDIVKVGPLRRTDVAVRKNVGHIQKKTKKKTPTLAPATLPSQQSGCRSTDPPGSPPSSHKVFPGTCFLLPLPGSQLGCSPRSRGWLARGCSLPWAGHWWSHWGSCPASRCRCSQAGDFRQRDRSPHDQLAPDKKYKRYFLFYNTLMSPWMTDSHSRGSRCWCGGSAPGQHLTCPASRDRGPRSQRRGRRGRGRSASAASRGRVSAPLWRLSPLREPRDCGPPGECWPWPRNHSIAQLIINRNIVK